MHEPRLRVTESAPPPPTTPSVGGGEPAELWLPFGLGDSSFSRLLTSVELLRSSGQAVVGAAEKMLDVVGELVTWWALGMRTGEVVCE